MADYQLRARIPHELADKMKEIVEELNAAVPEAEVTMSTVSRYALKEYVRLYDERMNNGLITCEIPVNDLKEDELEKVMEAFKLLNSVHPTIGEKEMNQLQSKINSLAVERLLKAAKGGEK